MVEGAQAPRPIRSGLIQALAVVILVAAGAILFGQQIRGDVKQVSVGPEKGQIAPDFSARTLDGEIVHLSDFHGKKVILNFFATWCEPCRAEAPHLSAAYKRKSNTAAFIGLTFQDTDGSLRSFDAEYELPFPLVLDDSGNIGQIYHVRSLPTTFFIRADGVVHYMVKGPMTKELVELTLEGMPEP